MSASRSSPAIGINLIVLPLSPVTVLQHYLSRSLRSNSYMRQNAYHRYATRVNSRTKSFASFATCLCRQRSEFSELQAHHCM